MNTANLVIKKLNFNETSVGSFDNELSNNELHDLLNEECTGFQEILDQDTWIFSDGSYITRLDSDYFVAENIDLFLLESEM